jgi:hypothetical protein
VRFIIFRHCFVYREELQMERLELLLEAEEGMNRSLPVNFKNVWLGKSSSLFTILIFYHVLRRFRRARPFNSSRLWPGFLFAAGWSCFSCDPGRTFK